VAFYDTFFASGNFQSMSLLPDPSSQVNPIFYAVPEAAVSEAVVPEAGSSWQEHYRAPGTLHSLGDFCQQ
jgi:hypothetical protein